MNTSRSLVSVVIPTFNRRQSLLEVVSPLLEDPCTGEVVLVVDGCHDGSYEFLGEWAQREPRIHVTFQENAGPAAARQRGVEEARYDTVVLLDDDVRASAGLVSAHARWHVDNEHRLVVGYMPTRVPLARRPGQAATILYAQDYESACKEYEHDPGMILTYLWSGNLSLRRSSALEIGSRTETFLEYHEDIRFGILCKEAGLEAVFDRSLLAWHSYSRSLRKFASECRRSGEGRAQLSREYPELADGFNPLMVLSAPEVLIVRLLGSKQVRPISAPLAMATSYGSGLLRAWRLEILSARVLRKIEVFFAFNRARQALGRSEIG